MSKLVEEHGWVWSLVQNKSGVEEIVGQYYEEDNISFIPAFTNKDDAVTCYRNLTLSPGVATEVQAIYYKDLLRDAKKNGFLIFILDGAGKILDKIQP